MESKNTLVIAALVVGLLVGAGVGYTMLTPKEVEVNVPGETQTVEVEVPALSGTITLGSIFYSANSIETSGVVTTLAMEDLNAYVDDLGLDLEFEMLTEHADGSTSVALEKIQFLNTKGVSAISGPMASSHLSAMKDIADERHIILFSEGSTAPQLSIADDYIYRLSVTDEVLNDALARIILERGASQLIVVHKDNAYGVGAKDAVVESFNALGGNVVEILPYVSESVEFSTLAATMSDIYKGLLAEYSADEIAVAVYAQGEINPMMSAFLQYPELADATYYSNEGFLRSEELTAEVAGIEQPRIFTMVMGLIKNEKFQEVENRYTTLSGRDSMAAYYGNTYDIIQLYGRAILETGSTDGEVLKEAIPKVAENYYGITGWCKLNEYGDRGIADFELYTIEHNGTAPVWEYAGMFSSSTSTMNWAYDIE